jgi:hypothetical protein|tara:strand:- start:203 stop:454 length:252 start_codon:yes stop_codon:yes gene_type:complete
MSTDIEDWRRKEHAKNREEHRGMTWYRIVDLKLLMIEVFDQLKKHNPELDDIKFAKQADTILTTWQAKILSANHEGGEKNANE